VTYLRTCKSCKFEKTDCDLRDDLRAQIKGMGITSIKFKCGKREPLFSVGQRVNVTWPVSYGGGEDYEVGPETWPATVVAERAPRFLICVDDVESDCGTPRAEYLKAGQYAKVPADRLAPLDEPAGEVCAVCHNIGPAFTGCYSQPGYHPFGCKRPGESGWPLPAPPEAP
jgi:hypothetical protein